MIGAIIIDDDETKEILFLDLVQQEIESLLDEKEGLQGQG